MNERPHDARCLALLARLSDYLDGECDAAIQAEIREHVEGCSPCEALLESLRRTILLLERQPGRRMPEEFRRACLEAAWAGGKDTGRP